MAIILETKTSFQGNSVIAQYRYKRKTWLLKECSGHFVYVLIQVLARTVMCVYTYVYMERRKVSLT